jgi:hypothetical protein
MCECADEMQIIKSKKGPLKGPQFSLSIFRSIICTFAHLKSAHQFSHPHIYHLHIRTLFYHTFFKSIFFQRRAAADQRPVAMGIINPAY